MNWNNELKINAPIEKVWEIINSKEYTEKIMPKLIKSTLIEDDTEKNIKVYRETYREGNRDETYNLTLTLLENSPTSKKQEFHFIIANTIESRGCYSLSKLDDNSTLFNYSGKNNGVNFIGKVMMLIAKFFSSDKESVDFLNRVKLVAEESIEE